MTRSSTKELFTPFKDSEREFCSSRKLFKTLSLDESRSPEFNLFFYLEENFEEEVTKTMAETMEEYMSKTRADYGSSVTRPKIDDKDHFELKGQFLKELRDRPQHLKVKFLSKYCPPARTTKKMEEINNFQQEPYETLYQTWERFKEFLMKCPQHYLTEKEEFILFYNGSEVPTRQIFDSKGAIPTKIVANAKVAIQGMAEYSQKWHNETSRARSTETSDGLAAIQAQLNNLGREIKKVYVAQVGCELCKGPHYTKVVHSKKKVKPLKKLIILNLVHPSNKEGNIEQQLRDSTKEIMQTLRIKNEDNQWKNLLAGASIKTLDIQIGQMSKVLQERGFGSLPSSTETNLRDHVKSISTTVEAYMTPIRRIRSPQYTVSAQQNKRIVWTAMLRSLLLWSYTCRQLPTLNGERPGSFTLPCYINNFCFENTLADLGASISVMPFSIYLNLDFIILDMPEDVKVPLILGRPFLSTTHAKIDVFKRKITLRFNKRMELDLEVRLMGETLVLNRLLDPLYGDYIELNDLNVPLELRRNQVNDLMPTIEECEDKVEYKGKNVVGAFMNVPIFVRNFSVVTHFAVVENIDGYRDHDMGDVIFGEPFYKASCVEARRFDGLITIHNGNDDVTYQMARSHPSFKHPSNA
ncbi:hypothetical protein Tco_1074913 [Tanacetum coccineum]